jgi:hypothetical protein
MTVRATATALQCTNITAHSCRMNCTAHCTAQPTAQPTDKHPGTHGSCTRLTSKLLGCQASTGCCRRVGRRSSPSACRNMNSHRITPWHPTLLARTPPVARRTTPIATQRKVSITSTIQSAATRASAVPVDASDCETASLAGHTQLTTMSYLTNALHSGTRASGHATTA